MIAYLDSILLKGICLKDGGIQLSKTGVLSDSFRCSFGECVYDALPSFDRLRTNGRRVAADIRVCRGSRGDSGGSNMSTHCVPHYVWETFLMHSSPRFL